jgi:hypothetical protein
MKNLKYIITGLSLKKMSKSEIGQVHWGDENSPHNPGSHLDVHC